MYLFNRYSLKNLQECHICNKSILFSDIEKMKTFSIAIVYIHIISASCLQIFREAMRTSPSIVYMPRINQWWDVLSESMRTTLLTTIQNLDPASPILLLATSEEPLTQIDAMVSAFLLLLHVCVSKTFH